jgi:hypothetical protein
LSVCETTLAVAMFNLASMREVCVIPNIHVLFLIPSYRWRMTGRQPGSILRRVWTSPSRLG